MPARSLRAGIWILALTLIGCSESPQEPAAGDPAVEQDIEFRVAGNAPLGTPWHAQWTRFEAAIVEADVGLTPAMFIGGQLGDPDTTMANTRRGRIQVGGFPLAGAAAVVPELNVLLTPYLFESEAEVDYVLDHHLLDAFQMLFEEKGLVLLQWIDAGWNNLYGNEGFTDPAQIAGRAMRSQPTLASQLFLEGMGADTIPLSFSEVLPGLQTGLIQGGESVTPIYLAAGLVGEAGHLTMTRHAYDSGVIVANAKWYAGLNEEQKRVLGSAIGEPSLMRAEVRGMVSAMIQDATADGRLTVHELSDEQRHNWQQAAAEQRLQLIEQIGGNSIAIMDAIEQGKTEFRNASEPATE